MNKIKFDCIVIPTLGRTETQVTYNNLPAKWQAIVKFVVQPHEYDIMYQKYGDKVVCLPEDIKGIAATRGWIWRNFSDKVYWCFDDDMKFRTKVPNGKRTKGGWSDSYSGSYFTDEDFDSVFDWAEKQMENGIHYGAMQGSTIILDSRQYPEKWNARLIGNAFYNAKMLPKYDELEWNRCPAAEDYDLLLQLLIKGYKNVVTTRWFVVPGTQKTGGCFTFRNQEVHNQSQLKLVELFPEYVVINSSKMKDENGPIKVIVKCAKAFNDSQKVPIKPNQLF